LTLVSKTSNLGAGHKKSDILTKPTEEVNN